MAASHGGFPAPGPFSHLPGAVGGRGAGGDGHQAVPRVGAGQAGTEALPQRVHDTALVEADEGGQILGLLQAGGVGLREERQRPLELCWHGRAVPDPLAPRHLGHSQPGAAAGDAIAVPGRCPSSGKGLTLCTLSSSTSVTVPSSSRRTLTLPAGSSGVPTSGFSCVAAGEAGECPWGGTAGAELCARVPSPMPAPAGHSSRSSVPPSGLGQGRESYPA